MLDWTRIEELRDEVGADAFAEVVELFLEEVGGVLDRLDPGSATLEEDLHFLKGAALNLGFAKLAGLCREGELAARAKAPPDLWALRACYAQSHADFFDRVAKAGYLAA
ncbi:Hpt domain-containing protein [Mangrovicoccus sp. HB161399]|uniref:Hpt domain-containing protein n=1 Tax=Mangrovicoccus sp. HB161399 TaxID=2720392 RepID=UPI001555A63D|nr:Hpt domain-containing protein [Mangrovicoccus sp. HB161399]